MCDDLYQSNDSGLQDDPISSADVVLIPACENEDGHQINRPQVEVYVERPLVSAQNRMSFDSETDGHRVTRNEWYLNVVACFNQAGYDFDRLTNIFATMPPILSDALKQGMHSMQVLSSFRATDGLAGQNLINRNLINRSACGTSKQITPTSASNTIPTLCSERMWPGTEPSPT